MSVIVPGNRKPCILRLKLVIVAATIFIFRLHSWPSFSLYFKDGLCMFAQTVSRNYTWQIAESYRTKHSCLCKRAFGREWIYLYL